MSGSSPGIELVLGDEVVVLLSSRGRNLRVAAQLNGLREMPARITVKI
jgi:hypothetical protein